jgi:hypothetical protein
MADAAKVLMPVPAKRPGASALKSRGRTIFRSLIVITALYHGGDDKFH